MTGQKTDRNPNELLESLDRLHTTKLGAARIRKNLGLTEPDVVRWCREQLQSSDRLLVRKGKNWYVKTHGCTITVNASSYTIITAHRNKNPS